MSLSVIVLTSKEVKRLIVKRSVELEIPLTHICSSLGISYKGFMDNYINGTEPVKSDITYKHVLKVLEALGVKVRYQFVVDTDFDVDGAKKKLNMKNNKLSIDG